MIPFLDQILSEMRHRFGEVHRTKIKLLGLIPSIVVDYDAASIDTVGELYRADLPSPEMLSTEFCRWKSKFAFRTSDQRPCSLQAVCTPTLRFRCFPKHSRTAAHCMYSTNCV